MFSNQNQQKISKEFCCIFCDYSTSRKSNYNDHLLSRKHKLSMIINQNQQKSAKNQQDVLSKFCCQLCGKNYKDIGTLKRHKESHSGIRYYSAFVFRA